MALRGHGKGDDGSSASKPQAAKFLAKPKPSGQHSTSNITATVASSFKENLSTELASISDPEIQVGWLHNDCVTNVIWIDRFIFLFCFFLHEIGGDSAPIDRTRSIKGENCPQRPHPVCRSISRHVASSSTGHQPYDSGRGC